MEPLETYEAKLKLVPVIVELEKSGSLSIQWAPVPRSEPLRLQQEAYRSRRDDMQLEEREEKQNAQADLESLRHHKRNGRIFKRLRQYHNRSITEPEAVAA
jgi:hypothetical protein